MWNMESLGQVRLSWKHLETIREQEGRRVPEWLAKKTSHPTARFFSASSSSSRCASTGCYQPHTSPPIRVRAAAKRSARRQLIGQDSRTQQLVAIGHPDAPDVTHTAPSILSAEDGENNKAGCSANKEQQEQSVQSCSHEWIKNWNVYQVASYYSKLRL